MIFLVRHRKATCFGLRILFFSVALYSLRQICDYFTEENYLATSNFPMKHIETANFVNKLKSSVPANLKSDRKKEVLKNDIFPNFQFPVLPQNISNRRKGEKVVQLTEKQLMAKIHSQNGGVSKDPIDFESIDVCIAKTQCFPFHAYATWRAQNLAFIVNNHLDPERVPPTLKSYPVSTEKVSIIFVLMLSYQSANSCNVVKKFNTCLKRIFSFFYETKFLCYRYLSQICPFWKLIRQGKVR